MRATFQEQRAGDRARLRVQIAEGFRFLWREAFLRTTAFVYGLGNFTIPGILFVVVVAGRRQGLSPAAIGVLTATIAACTFVGALLSPLVRRRLSARGVLLTELWATVGSAGFLVWPNVYVLVAGILPQAATFPVTDSVVKAYAIAVTPDRLLGRVESARRLIALLAAPLGPLVAGLLLETLSARATVGFFLAVGIALAMVGTASRALRSADYPAASAAGRSARRYKTS